MGAARLPKILVLIIDATLPTKPCRTRAGDKEWRNGCRTPTQYPGTDNRWLSVGAEGASWEIKRRAAGRMVSPPPPRISSHPSAGRGGERRGGGNGHEHEHAPGGHVESQGRVIRRWGHAHATARRG